MATFSLQTTDIKDKVTLLRTASPQQFNFVDETDWGTAGVDGLPPLSERYRSFKITVNSVVVYNNLITSTDVADWDGTNGTADMLSGVDTFDSSTLPSNTDGSFINGGYKIEVNTLYLTVEGSNIYEVVNSEITYDLLYDTPKGEITSSINLNPVNPELLVTDVTNYEVDGVIPINARELKYIPKPTSGLTSVTTSLTTITKNKFSTGTSFAELTNSNSATWDFSLKIDNSNTNTYPTGNNVLLLVDKVVTQIEIDVSSNLDFCAINCCLNTTLNRYFTAKSCGDLSLAKDIFNILNEATTLITISIQNRSCNTTESLNEILREVKDILDCGDNCGCDDAPEIVQPIDTGATSNTSVITFNTSSVSTAVFTRKPAGGGGSTFTSGEFANKTYSGSNQDFDVYYDGSIDLGGTLDTNTNTFTFEAILSLNVEVKIVFK